MILAGIDIGTNSLRLLIAETGNGPFRKICSDRRTTRLGGGLDRTGIISAESAERTLSGLMDFQLTIRKQGAVRTAVIGTSAFRNASNAGEFLREARRKTGLEIIVLSGEEEARLMLRGAAEALKQGRIGRCTTLDDAMVIDIGGGSTELIITRNGALAHLFSLPLGAVYLTERYLRRDPPLPEELALLRETVLREIDVCGSAMEQGPPALLLGTAGAVTTLAAMELQLDAYDPERVNGVVVTRECIAALLTKMSTMTRKERLTLRGLEQGREDIILAGSIVVQEIMERWGFTTLSVSDWGLREGLVLDLADRMAQGG